MSNNYRILLSIISAPFTILSIILMTLHPSSGFSNELCFGLISNPVACVERQKLRPLTIAPSQLRRAGLYPQVVFDSNGDIIVKTLPITCDVVPNGWGVTLTRELYASYKSRGFSDDAICIGLGADGIHFDPETGKQLPLYVFPRDLFDIVHPLYLPDCFESVKQTGSEGSWLIYFRPTGCEMKYHPTTGKMLEAGEDVILTAGGDGTPGVDDFSGAAVISDARLKELIINGK